MATVKLRDAKATLSRLVDEAEGGAPTVITRHGREVAMLVPIAEGRKLYPEKEPNLFEHLLAFPGRIDLDDRSPIWTGSGLRDVDFD